MFFSFPIDRQLKLMLGNAGAIATLSVIATAGMEVAIAGPTIVPNSDNTNTVVTQQENYFNISGGTSSGDGRNLFHSFQEFGLDADRIANFLSDPQIRNILSRINGGNPSVINGIIRVSGGNANLFLMNPAGIIFGPGARLNLSGDFFATTATGIELNGAWFDAFGPNDYVNLIGTASGFRFEANRAGAIINAGNLTVAPGNNLSLVGAQVIDTGSLNAPGGKITLSAVPGSSRVRITQEGQLLSLEVELPRDERGNALPIRVLDLPELLAGTLEGSNLGLRVSAAGDIELTASGTAIPNLPGINVISGQVNVSSSVDRGGEIQISGDRVGLVGAKIDASGTGGGGSIAIGGDYRGGGALPHAEVTFVDKNTDINADAWQRGDGGKVVVWAKDTTRFQGRINARGGMDGGNGGLVETSGKRSLESSGGFVDASATSGEPGNWLLDPTDVNIVLGAPGQLTNGVFAPNTGVTPSSIDPNTIANAMNLGTSVEINTSNGTGGNGDITLTDSINQTGGGAAGLTLTGRRFERPGTATINLTGTGGLIFNLNQINPEALAPLSSVQNAIGAIGNVAGASAINLGAGTYESQAAATRLTIDKNVTLRGAGTAVTNNTTLEAIGIDVVAGNVVIEGIIIDNVQRSGNGGAVTISAPAVATINNSTIQNNEVSSSAPGVTADGNGGAIFNSGTLNLTNSVIANNGSQNNGGGIFNSGTLTIRNNAIENNQAVSGGGIFNSGILNTDNTTIFTNNQPDNIFGPQNVIAPLPAPTPPPPAPTPTPPPAPTPTPPTVEGDPRVISPEEKTFATLDKSPGTIQIRYIEQARQILQNIQNKAAEKSALIYVNFLPPGVEFDQETFFARMEATNTSEFEQFLNLPTDRSSQSLALPFSKEDRLELLLITADGKPKKITVAATREQVMQVAQQLYEEVANLRSDYLAPAEQLYRWLIAPIAEELKIREVENLAFILPPGLRLLPLAALYDRDNSQYLVQQYSVGLAPSINLIDLSYRNLQDVPVLAAGASQFKPEENQPSLPAVEVEVTQIAERLRGGKTVLNEEFTLENFKQARQANPFPIVHLATHADFQKENPEQIYLQFYDRKLELQELRELNLYEPTVDLMVISACRSAYGDEEAELGFGGLAVQAGAKSALASLWYVGDTGTLGLMSEFYRQLAKEPIKAEALREAQVAMISGEVKKQGKQIVTPGGNISLPAETSELEENLSHPFYWAAFTLIGSPW